VSVVPARAAPSFSVELPGVHSWERMTVSLGKSRYPKRYVGVRTVWGLVVRQAVAAAGWETGPDDRYQVEIWLRGDKGRRDIDRVATAVFDALQNGGAISEDCKVDVLRVDRSRERGVLPAGTSVTVRIL
jgi:hypothetical protein